MIVLKYQPTLNLTDMRIVGLAGLRTASVGKVLLSGIIVAMILSAVGRPAQAEELKLCASIAVMFNIFSKITDPFEKKTGIKLKFTRDPKGNSTPDCFMDVDQGVAEAACTAVIWGDVAKTLQDLGYTPKNKMSEFENQVIAHDRIQVLTYPKGPKKLTAEQIKAVFTGAVKNWQEVGGENQEIIVVHSEHQPSALAFLRDKYFDKQGLEKAHLKLLKSDVSIDMMPKIIAQTPGAVGFGPINLVRDGVNAPEVPTMGRPITCFQKGGFSPKMRTLMQFIVREGAKNGVAE